MDQNSNSPQLPTIQPQERWVKFALYVGLLLVVGWLYFSSASDTRPANGDRGGIPTASTERSSEKTSDVPKPRQGQEGRANESRGNRNPANTQSSRTSDDEETGNSLVVHNARVTNEDNDVIYRGDVDLTATLQRIERGKRLRFSHDGITFENRERRLPAKPGGYYQEFVHPTPGVEGPGGQRVVLGRDGEVYYTPDHYRTFRRVR